MVDLHTNKQKKTTPSNGGGCCCYKRDGNVVLRLPFPLLLLHSYCYTRMPCCCKHNGDVDVCDNDFPFLFLLLHPSTFMLTLLLLCYQYYMRCCHVELHTNKQKEKPKSHPPQSNGGICCCCKCDGDVATCDNVLPLLLVLLLHSYCYTFMPSSSSYYYIAATQDVMMIALLLPHEM